MRRPVLPVPAENECESFGSIGGIHLVVSSVDLTLCQLT